MFTNMVDFGLNVQEAVEAPCFCSSSLPQSPWPHRTYANRLQVEVVGPWGIRNGFTPIVVNPETGVCHGGADPRKESVMLSW